MGKNILFVISIVLYLVGFEIQAQTYTPPTSYSFKSVEDYHRYDAEVVKCINWTEKLVPGERSESVKSATRFLWAWMVDNPYVNYSGIPRMETFFDDCPEYKVFYLAGWSKYALKQGNKLPSKLSCSYAGIKAVIGAYNRKPDNRRDMVIADLVTIDKNGKLMDWVKEHLN